MKAEEFGLLIEKLEHCEIALYQIDQCFVLLLALIMAGIVCYAIWYCLVRFTWF